MNWRAIFNFEGVEVSFSDVHTAYRQRMTAGLMEPETMIELTAALEAARKELASGKSR